MKAAKALDLTMPPSLLARADTDPVISRRAFVASFAGNLLAVPVAVEAQQQARTPPRIGWLTSSVVHQNNVEAFRDAMRALGYPDINLDVRAAAGRVDHLPALAAELLQRNVEVIVTDGGQAAFAAKNATAAIPIVIGATAGDVVKQGLVASVAHPGGNVTGLTLSADTQINGKRLELLREALPTLKQVAVLWNFRSDVNHAALRDTERAAKALGVHLDTRETPDIERAFSSVVSARATAIFTIADAFLLSQRGHIVALAARHRLPGMFPEEEFVEAGGLMTYGPHVADNFRRAATYVDKILKGAKPGDLPIEQPTRYKLAINLKTARTLGLTIPPSLLARADQVIE